MSSNSENAETGSNTASTGSAAASTGSNTASTGSAAASTGSNTASTGSNTASTGSTAAADPNTITNEISNFTEQISETIKELKKKMHDLDPKIKALQMEQMITLQSETVNSQLLDAAKNAERAGVSYERAKQLQASGKYIADMQERVLQRNRQALGGMNADIMTAKRIATVNQQNTIHANNVTDYMRTSIIFLCVAIVIMFIFGMAMNFFKKFIAHPVVIMQVLLIILATIYIIVILYKIITNTNHYNMLYQERVFPYYAFDDKPEEEDCECPDNAKTNDPEDPSGDVDPCESASSNAESQPVTNASIEKANQTAEDAATIQLGPCNAGVENTNNSGAGGTETTSTNK